MRPRTFRLLLGCLAAFAVALRLWHVTADLPDFLEEAVPFRNALDLWAFTGGRPDWNPHLFHYPSLSVYLHHFVQWLGYLAGRLSGVYASPADWFVAYLADPTAAVVPARVLHACLDGAAVIAAGLVGERLRRGAGLVAAALVALAPNLIETGRWIFIETLMAALALWSLERMLAWRERGGAGRLAAAVVLAGLAVGAKYQAAALALPLAWVLVERRGLRGLALWPALVAGMAVVFLLTTPYAVLDAATFRRDLAYLRALTAHGYFGNSGAAGAGYLLRNLLRDAGPAGAGLLLVSLGLTLARARRAAPAVTVWLYLLAFGLPFALARVEAARYLVPLAPAVAALAAAAALDIAGWLGGGRRRLVQGALLVALVAPVAWTGAGAAAAGGRLTRVAARAWCEEHVGAADLVMTEMYAAPLASLDARAVVERSPAFRAASGVARQRYLARRWLHAVSVPLTVVGPCTSLIRSPEGAVTDVAIFPEAGDVNQIFYEPRLFAGADYVITSSAVRGRFEADPARQAIACRLYRLLDSTATVAARFAPGRGLDGPTIVIYRIDPRARASLADGAGLAPLWWAERIPMAYRRRATALLGATWREGAAREPDGAPAPWVRSLEGPFRERIQPYTDALALHLAELGRLEGARSLADVGLLMDPDDVEARLVREYCDEARGAATDSSPAAGAARR